MIDPTAHPLICIVLGGIVVLVLRSLFLSYRVHQRARALGCQPGVYGYSGPFGLAIFIKLYKAAKRGQRLELHRSLYKQYGAYTFKQRIPGLEVLFTIEPENVKAILATQFNDFGMGHRLKVWYPVLGDGIFNADGHKWAYARTLLRPQFTKDQVGDLELMDQHVTDLISAIPRDGSTFDIQPLFYSFTNDTSTHFLFGESLARSSSGDAAKRFAKAFDKSQEWLSRRLGAQQLHFLVDRNKDYQAACDYVHQIADHYVQLALQARRDGKKSDRYVFLQALADDNQDPKVLRDNILNLLIAGRDTTASLLSSTIAYLSRYPNVWQRLRQEIVDEFGDATRPLGTITHTQIKGLRYLRCILNETLRLLPPVPVNSRVALKDTSLPLGGGPDGKSPVFVSKGTMIPFSIHAMHRRQDLWGPDADVFQPERWEKGANIHTWDYIPFNGGPRICLGQQYALVEASYVIIRLAQRFNALDNGEDHPGPDPLVQADLTLSHPNGVHVKFH